MEKHLIGCRNSYEVWQAQADAPPPALSFEPYLYNRWEHLRTQRPVRPVSVWLWNKETESIDALLRADYEDTEVWSLPNAPFGGVQHTPDTPPEVLMFLLSCLETWCREQSVARLSIKEPPSCYGEEAFGALHEAYTAAGFRIAQSLTNHHIAVVPGSFMEIISSAERRRLRACLRANFRYGVWSDPDSAEVYDFLSMSRRNQGYLIPMSAGEFDQLLTQLPGSTQVLTVRDGDKIISLTVAIRVNSRILYNFCPADDPAYRRFSPTVMLNAALYEYAQTRGIELIDLGTSLDNGGREKASLVRFKENLGGQPSVKLTYEKVLPES